MVVSSGGVLATSTSPAATCVTTSLPARAIHFWVIAACCSSASCFGGNCGSMDASPPWEDVRKTLGKRWLTRYQQRHQCRQCTTMASAWGVKSALANGCKRQKCKSPAILHSVCTGFAFLKRVSLATNFFVPRMCCEECSRPRSTFRSALRYFLLSKTSLK